MIRYLSLLTAVAVGFAANASAGGLKGQPYTFTGTVSSANSACPYAAGATVAGYTLIEDRGGMLLAPALIFSPGGSAPKLTIRLSDLPDNGAGTGNLSVVSLPSTAIANGTYSSFAKQGKNGAFTLKLTPTVKITKNNCLAVFNLTFAKGLPTNLFNIL